MFRTWLKQLLTEARVGMATMAVVMGDGTDPTFPACRPTRKKGLDLELDRRLLDRQAVVGTFINQRRPSGRDRRNLC
jgi:hypothetical protein